VEEGKARDSLTLKGFEGVAEVNGRRHKVKVKGGEAVEEKQNGKKLLRLKIKAEVGRVEGEYTIVDRVVREYTITFSRRTDNAALVKALTSKELRVYRMKDGKIMIECYEGHLEGFAHYAELADDIEKWLEETSRRAPPTGRG
jgi:hypothetical protein